MKTNLLLATATAAAALLGGTEIAQAWQCQPLMVCQPPIIVCPAPVVYTPPVICPAPVLYFEPAPVWIEVPRETVIREKTMEIHTTTVLRSRASGF